LTENTRPDSHAHDCVGSLPSLHRKPYPSIPYRRSKTARGEGWYYQPLRI